MRRDRLRGDESVTMMAQKVNDHSLSILSEWYSSERGEESCTAGYRRMMRNAMGSEICFATGSSRCLCRAASDGYLVE